MHFGYCRSFMDLFSNRKCIANLNKKVLQEFHLKKKKQLIDIGCGMGGTMQYAQKNYPNFRIKGITISKLQTSIGNKVLQKLSSSHRIIQGNYENLPYLPENFEGAYAIESLCHSGYSKKAISEIYRTLKPGGLLVISDAFTHEDFLPQGALKLKYKMQQYWRLQKLISIEKLYEKLIDEGFTIEKIENITFRVAPSLLRVPCTIAKFYFSHWWTGKKITQVSKDNAWASFYALLTAYYLRYFGYYFILAKKPENC